MRTKKGIIYFETWQDAWTTAKMLRDRSFARRYPYARVVPYQLGSAVQYYRSGPYYPELEG